MRQHDPFRRATGARSVNQAGQCVRRDLSGVPGNIVGRGAVAHKIGRHQTGPRPRRRLHVLHHDQQIEAVGLAGCAPQTLRQ